MYFIFCGAEEIPCWTFRHVPFPRGQELSIYLSWDKDFITLAKKRIHTINETYNYIFLISQRRCGLLLEAPDPNWGASNEYSCFLHDKKFSGKWILVGQEDFDQLLVRGQVIKFDNFSTLSLFVCVEVLRPSQPNGVMLSAVSLPNHTFIGQA